MKTEYKVLIRISGNNASKKHAKKLTSYLQNNLKNEAKIIIQSIIIDNYNFNISIEGDEIFAKRKFWNKYPNYSTILNKIRKFLEQKEVYAAIKASYDWHNELF